MYPITVKPSNPTLQALKVTYVLDVIAGSVRPIVFSPLHVTKHQVLQMWFSPSQNKEIIKRGVEAKLAKMYTL